MTARISVKDLQPGHSIPGLDNAYVIEVERANFYTSIPSTSYGMNVALDSWGAYYVITFNDAEGGEGYLLLPADMPVIVDNAEPHTF